MTPVLPPVDLSVVLLVIWVWERLRHPNALGQQSVADFKPLGASHHESVVDIIEEGFDTHNEDNAILFSIAVLFPERVCRADDHVVGAKVVRLEIEVL